MELKLLVIGIYLLFSVFYYYELFKEFKTWEDSPENFSKIILIIIGLIPGLNLLFAIGAYRDRKKN